MIKHNTRLCSLPLIDPENPSVRYGADLYAWGDMMLNLYNPGRLEPILSLHLKENEVRDLYNVLKNYYDQPHLASIRKEAQRRRRERGQPWKK